ncbi:MAG TPA: carbon-nitrogen family hydrolase [Tepidisphaeraceae bacterium]|jgi:predicted amidohydrolase|nr:carbon-nitrogen family hydrolase [Tepidisphaeraceae bacterium]
MKIYGVQLDIAWEDKAANHTKVRRLLENFRPEKGSLVVLPEMFDTGFTMEVAKVSDEKSGMTRKFLADLANELGVWVMGGFVNSDSKSGRNEAAVFDPQGKEVVRYQKIHPFTRGGEARCYSAGSEVKTFRWGEFTVCPFICYDLRFPEIFRTAVRRGANLFVVIANWPLPREGHWATLLEARAIENLAYVVGVNRAGNDPKYVYFGRSRIIDPHGKVIAEAGREETVISADVDLGIVDAWRKDFPALSDIHAEYIPK